MFALYLFDNRNETLSVSYLPGVTLLDPPVGIKTNSSLTRVLDFAEYGGSQARGDYAMLGTWALTRKLLG